MLDLDCTAFEQPPLSTYQLLLFSIVAFLGLKTYHVELKIEEKNSGLVGDYIR